MKFNAERNNAAIEYMFGVDESSTIEHGLVIELQNEIIKNNKKIGLLQKVIDAEEPALNDKLNDISNEYDLIKRSMSIQKTVNEFNRDVDIVMKLSRDTEEYKRQQELKHKQQIMGKPDFNLILKDYVSAKFKHLKLKLGNL